MNIILLNTNSFGGNYEYSRYLAKAYSVNSEIGNCTVLIPVNSIQEENLVFKKILLSDISLSKSAFVRKLYFLYRSIVNPFRVYKYLKRLPASIIIFNDFDQISAPIWAPLFKRLKKKHVYIVILHDPDRDKYLPWKMLSEYTMHKVMSIMDIALYHEVLPDKVYYKKNLHTVNIPHGIYNYKEYDAACLEQLVLKKGNSKLIGILGNIRDEKNYGFIIESLTKLPDTKLLIAGAVSSSNVPVTTYKKMIEHFGIADRVIWMEKFLTEGEFQSAVKACDIILLYYKSSFTSQSGVLNVIAPHKKNILISNVPSALRETVQRFGLGKIADLSEIAFIDAVNQLNHAPEGTYSHGWSAYLNYASWDNHVKIVLSNLNNFHKKQS